MPHLISQSELNDLVRDLSLSKTYLEILVSRPQGWNLLQQDVKMYGKGQQSVYLIFFSKNGELVYCNVVEGLLQELGCAQP